MPWLGKRRRQGMRVNRRPRARFKRPEGGAPTANRPHLFLVLILALATSLGTATPAAAAPRSVEAMEFVRQGVARMIELLASKHMSRRAIAERLHEELRLAFDVPTMARLALGVLGRDITQEQERRYLHEFERFIVHTYAQRIFNVQPKIGRDALADTVEVIGTTPVDSEQILVHGRVKRAGARPVEIDWRIREQGNRLRVIDISVLGISQVLVNRSEFIAVARRNNGIDGLIEVMRRKNEAFRAD